MARVFESQSCGRCGGSGSYSFNQIDGDRCYGCGGSGVVLSKRGKAARAYLHSLQERPVSEIKPGEYLFFAPLGRVGKFREIDRIEPCKLNPGMLIVYFKRADLGSYGIWESSKVRSVKGQADLSEQIAAALAFQDSLGKNGKPLKRSPSAAKPAPAALP